MNPLDAPIYRPAKAYTPPKRLPQALNTGTYSLTALMEHPVTAAIITKEMPQMKMVAGSRDRKVFFTTVTLRDLSVDTPAIFPPAALDKIDIELAKLPKSEWPTNDY